MKKNVALVLGSGGARGIVHIGVIRELEKQGYNITSIAGTSMGAVIGAVYATGNLDKFENWICSLTKKNVFQLIDFTISGKGIIKADRVLKEIQNFMLDQDIEDLPIHFSAVATDLKQKKEIVIRKGSIYQAIRASISIPVVFTPLKKDDTLYVDGGLINPVPVNRVLHKKDDLLVAVNLNTFLSNDKEEKEYLGDYVELYKKRFNMFQTKIHKTFYNSNKKNMGYFNIINSTTDLMLAQISSLTLELYPPDILIEFSRDLCGSFDFYKATELIQKGRIKSKQKIDYYNKTI